MNAARPSSHPATRRGLAGPPRSAPDLRAKAHGCLAAARDFRVQLVILSGLASACGHPTQPNHPNQSATDQADSSPRAEASLAGGEASAWSGGVEPSPAAEARIEELLQAMEPLPQDLTSDHLDRAFWQRRSIRARLREAGDEGLGIAALRSYTGCEEEDSLLRQALLEVAAHNAPEASRELLLTLMTTYGFRIDDRAYAAQYLAETSPGTYLEAARPFVLRRGRATKTMPDDEFLVRDWVIACRALDRSPVEELADVVTNLMMQDAARHYAAQVLGQYPDPKGRRALETVLIESSGNGYLRRKAAQALRESLPAETACTLFRTVFEREADINFGKFLGDMIAQLCH